jgi:hypothetical protein
VLASNYPSYDQVMMVVNSIYYGGSGGSIATATKNVSSGEIAIHEIGHSFASLADEYWAGAVYAAEKPNMTAQSNSTVVKWKNWVGTNSVGVYPYVGGPGWYRPVQNSQCKMEVLNAPFCPVCKEAIVERIHTLVRPYDGYSPSNAGSLSPAGTMGFRLNLLNPNPNTLKVVWKLDNVTIANNTDTITVNGNTLGTGSHNIVATIVDTTTLTRSDTHASAHSYSIQWTISTATGVLSPELNSLRLSAYPNPFREELHINYELKKRSELKIELVNMAGVVVKSLDYKNQEPGKYLTTINTSGGIYPPGIYLLVFTLNGNRMVEEKVKL